MIIVDVNVFILDKFYDFELNEDAKVKEVIEEIVHMVEQKEKTAFFIGALQKIPGCTIIPEVRAARPDLYSPWIVQASFKGIPGEVAVRALSERAFYISTGSACSARKHKRPVLSAMKIDEDTARSSVRFSFGLTQTQKDIEALIEAVREVNALFGQKT